MQLHPDCARSRHLEGDVKVSIVRFLGVGMGGDSMTYAGKEHISLSAGCLWSISGKTVVICGDSVGQISSGVDSCDIDGRATGCFCQALDEDGEMMVLDGHDEATPSGHWSREERDGIQKGFKWDPGVFWERSLRVRSLKELFPGITSSSPCRQRCRESEWPVRLADCRGLAPTHSSRQW